MTNEQLQNNEDIDPVSHLLRELKHVDAPANFDLGVRGRIAAGRPEEKRAFRIPALVGYAIPLALMLIVGGYFGFNALYSTTDANVPVVELNETKDVVPPIPAPSAEVTAPPQTAKSDEQLVVKKPENSGDTAVKKPAARDKSPGGGSFDQASREGRRINLNSQIPAKDILNLIGAKGGFEADGWRVRSTVPNSLAERSQIRAGDLIESLNDRPVTDKTSFRSRTPLKSVRVRRDGQTIDIAIKN